MSSNKEQWQLFRDAGLLWFVNNLLHIFGWCIFILEDGSAVPEQISSFTGFPRESELRNKRKMAVDMRENAQNLINNLDDIMEEESNND